MTTFANAVDNRITRTENGMKAFKSSGDSLTNLFFKIGASRGKNIIPEFTSAFVQDKELATRIALWTRDVRGGAGERKLFRDILVYLESNAPEILDRIFDKIAEIGRFDDYLVFSTQKYKHKAYDVLFDAILSGNQLASKWIPREKSAKTAIANEIMTYWNMTPRQYRKFLATNTTVVETKMCSNAWTDINYSHVPSVASARYKKAFNKHDPVGYTDYVNKLNAGDASVKVNAGAVYPYDVLKGIISPYGYSTNYKKTELDLIVNQWNALENFVGDANILPLVDVSGSMCTPAGTNASVTCLDVAVSLGLYLSEKNKGKFKDLFVTFSTHPEILHLQGNIVDRCNQMIKSKWAMSTDLHSALDLILTTAINGNVPREEMPNMLLILSDMQFNQCTRFDDSAYQMIRRKYENAGYECPALVFWNINAKDNVPVRHDASGVALVSGFSPAILGAVLSADSDSFTPEGIMLKAIMNPKYDF
jgi:hypothetical protein